MRGRPGAAPLTPHALVFARHCPSLPVTARLRPSRPSAFRLPVLAIWAIATGLVQIVAAIRLRKEIEGEFWLGLAGFASVAFGVFLIARPGAGALAVLWLIGGYAVAWGIILVILGLKARGFAQRMKGAFAT